MSFHVILADHIQEANHNFDTFPSVFVAFLEELIFGNPYTLECFLSINFYIPFKE